LLTGAHYGKKHQQDDEQSTASSVQRIARVLQIMYALDSEGFDGVRHPMILRFRVAACSSTLQSSVSAESMHTFGACL
jgi:hypothetical protein